MQNIIEFMNKYFTYLIAIISGLVGVFAFSPFDYLAFSPMFLYSVYFMSLKILKIHRTFSDVFVVDGIFLLWGKLA